jgi:phage terminase small subunit
MATKIKPKSTRKRSRRVKRRLDKDSGLTMRQRKFCEEYIFDWNATRSYQAAYANVKNANTAGVMAHRLLRNGKVQKFIEDIQQDLEKLSGISRMRVINEHMKLAFSSIAHLHNTWIQRRDFEQLTDAEKACISEISTQTRNMVADDGSGVTISVDFVKIKLYDKQKALDSISKMLGYEAPVRTELTGKDGKPLTQTITIEVINKAEQVRKDDSGR